MTPANRQLGQPPARRNAPLGSCCRRLVEPAGSSGLDQRLATSPEAEELVPPHVVTASAKVLRLCRRHECVRNEKARARRIDSLDVDAYPDVPCHGVEREPAGVGDAERDRTWQGRLAVGAQREVERSRWLAGVRAEQFAKDTPNATPSVAGAHIEERVASSPLGVAQICCDMPRVDVVAGEPHSPHVHVTGFQRRRDGRAPGVRLTPQRESTLARAPRTATARSSTPGGRRTLSCR